jgi:hypothetical protein
MTKKPLPDTDPRDLSGDPAFEDRGRFARLPPLPLFRDLMCPSPGCPWAPPMPPERVQRTEVSALIPEPSDSERETEPGEPRCDCETPLPGPEHGLPDGYCGRCGKAAV